MACKSAEMMPIMAMLVESCTKARLGKQLFEHFNAIDADDVSEIDFWAEIAREGGIDGFCWWLVLVTMTMERPHGFAVMLELDRFFTPNH